MSYMHVLTIPCKMFYILESDCVDNLEIGLLHTFLNYQIDSQANSSPYMVNMVLSDKPQYNNVYNRYNCLCYNCTMYFKYVVTV